MRELFVEKVINTVEDFLDNNQRIKLKEILTEICLNYQIERIEQTKKQEILKNNTDILNKFISSKEIEGCSTRTLNYYKDNITKMLDTINLPIDEITTEILRNYLADYKSNSKAGMVTIDNIRRTLSSFFTWLENEDYIVKSPVRRIHKVKTTRRVKETLTDENLEKLRDTCSNVRDLAILELLISTGMRVGEITRLNISDMNFQERSCIVLGKGNSEREVYFSAKSKMYIEKYLETRIDNNEALFVSLIKPYNRLGISGIEILIRNLGKEANINKVHPHKFRRTMATMAIDKGMPIEQVQKLLGHIKIDTTMEYAMVNQNNVKNSHRKYVT
ncbi:MAG TPA: tyrosine-type recombinase/integrase [Clostridiaceae bacterium]|jgi:integrase/recombinase XerD|nr:tyrosine-type recombinase/integrase [Clostridiaceae bacterium]